MKKRLFAVMIIVSLVSTCSGSEQAIDVPAPTSVARATSTPETPVPPKEMPAPTVTDLLPVPPTYTTTAMPIPPTAISTATTRPGLGGTPLTRGSEPVTRNDDWLPYIEEFAGVQMALVPAGCFDMGSTDEQVADAMQQCEEARGAGNCERSWYEDEQPAEKQCFAEPFWIDVYEVTNVQYGSAGNWSGDELPREQVNWADAVAHCASRGARLPTEAEWEYAARGPDGLAFPWGDLFRRALVNSCDRSCEWNLIGTGVDDGYANTAPVGSYAGGASWVGAMDMSGNVWEWTSSIYMEYPYSPTDGREVDGRTDSSSRRVLRGGAWFHSGSDLLRSAARYAVSPDYVDYVVGFRCAVPSSTTQAGDLWPSWESEGAPSSGALLSFEKSAQPFASVPTYQIGLADLDGDGDLDAVFANGQASDSQVWLNDGGGFFTDSGQQLGKYAHGVNVGDLDSDGDPDLLINTHLDSAPSRVYLNDGRAIFQELEGAFEVNIGFNVHLFDLDGDGDLDAVGEAAHAADVYLNDGTGAFSASETSFPLTTAWGDLDADGDVDVLVKEHGVGYAVHLNDGQGRFGQHWTHADDAAMNLGDIALGDIDTDGDLDAILTNGHFQSTSHPARIFLNDGTGRFTDSGQQLSAVRNAGVSLGDLDGDGDLDLVLSDYFEPCQIWLNDGNGQFTDSGFRFGDDQFYRHIHLGDLDADGDWDIFLATFGMGQGPNEIWFNTTPRG